MNKNNFLLESEMEIIVGGGDISLLCKVKNPKEITQLKLQKPEEITL